MVRVLPLGGLGEIGMNCMAIVSGNDALVVDCGVTFADRAFGADVVHPDFSELSRYDVRGVVLTHGHEDHIGALPYFLSRFDVPVWGPRYAMQLLDERASEHEILSYADLRDVAPRQRFAVGPFTVEPIRVAHSTADACALAIDTDAGTLLHTGDFKFDDEAAAEGRVDEERLRELARAGISLLLSDSTNADRDGFAGSERTVAGALEAMIASASGAVVVSLFASNVERLDVLGRIAEKTGRKLVLVGRSMQTHARAARRRGLLGFSNDILWPEDRCGELVRSRILALATGSQGEPNAALSRLSRNAHEDGAGLSLREGDLLILSSRVIPGHELDVQHIVADFLRRGVEVRWPPSDPDVHVSGHACRDEQSRMIELTEPRAFLPIHGAVHHLHGHAKLASAHGVGSVLIVENGQSARLETGGVLTRDADFPVGKVFTWDKKEVAHGVLGERRALAQDGIASLHLTLDAGFALVEDPKVVSRGVMTEPALDRAIRDVRREIDDALSVLGLPRDEARVTEAARLATRRALARVTGRKPVVVVTVTHKEYT